MYDIITFGSATEDIYLIPKNIKILENKENFGSEKGVCFDLGSKIEIKDIFFATGGGGTNAAATLANQGFRVAFCGAIGADIFGLEIVRDLKKFRIDTKLIVKKKDKKTNVSVIISSEGGERTILAYRGASEALNKEDIPWRRIKKTRWFYLAPLTGAWCLPEQATLFGQLVNFAKENNIKVAINPSKQQLSLPTDELNRILAKVDILFLNQEEAAFLTKNPFGEEQKIFKRIDEVCPGVAVMTRGAKGVVVSDGKFLYSAPANPDIKIIDTTGAGDSFAAGFLSDYIRYNGDIEKAIQLGLANSQANLSQIGAKTGLLTKKSSFERVAVIKEELKD